jgi:hypothetical protein
VPVNWIFSSSSAGQEIQGEVVIIVVLRSVIRTESNFCHKLPTDFVGKGMGNIHNSNSSKKIFG